MMCWAITARSRGVLRWPTSVRPVTFLKVVFFRPQACAWRFIIATNCSTVPPTASASATAASFPLCTISPCSSSSSVGVMVVSMNISEPPPLRSSQARLDTEIFWSRARRFSFTALNTRYAVISLVSDAGSALWSALRSASTWSLVMSTRM
jgi:hypothetical protein